MQHENTHFVQLESHSLLFQHYAFVDTNLAKLKRNRYNESKLLKSLS